jgi:hypothetical protein
MKHDKVLWLLSSAAPFVVVLGFSSSVSSTLRPSTAFIGPSAPCRAFATRRLMFGGGSGNPLEVVSSMFSSKISSEAVKTVNQGLAALSITDWDTIRSELESKMMREDEKNFRANLEKGYGVASPMHKIRLFDKSNDENDIRVTFYRDSASTF